MREQFILSIDHPIIKNHRVYGQAVLPGLAYIDMVYELFRENGYDYTELELRNLSIYNPLIVTQEYNVMCSIQCSEIKAGQWRIIVEGQEERNGIYDLDKICYVTAEMHRISPVVFDEKLDTNRIQQSAKKIVSLEKVYGQCCRQELVHTGFMKTQGRVYDVDTSILIDISIGQEAFSSAAGFMFHPALIDGSGIGSWVLFSSLVRDKQRLFLPLCYESFCASALLQKKCITRIQTSSMQQKKELLYLTLEFFNESGEKVAELKNFANKLVREAGLINSNRKEDKQSTKRTESINPFLIPTSMPNNDSNSNNTVQFIEFEFFIRELLADRLKKPIDQIDTQAGYYEMGLDSPGLLEIVHAIETKIEATLPPTLMFEYTTIAELSAYLTKNYATKINQFSEVWQDIELKMSNCTSAEFPSGGQSLISEFHVCPKSIHEGSVAAEKTLKIEEDIAIIGMAGRYPQARNLQEFWMNLKGGKDCISEIPKSRWNWQQFKGVKSPSGKSISKWGGFIDDSDCFDAQFFRISPREAKVMDPQERLFLEICWEAIEDAGYTPKKLVFPRGPNKRQHVGVFVGVMHKDYTQVGADAIFQGSVFPLSLNYASIANRVSYFCDFHGPSMAIDTVCSSSLIAVHSALESIRHGECEVALAGGVNLSLHPNKYLTYGMANMHSSDGHCHTFGKGGDGYVSGEGVGTILLKPLHKAIQDGDNIYAIVRGSTINHGGAVSGITVPSPVAQADLIVACLEKTGINPRTISYVEAHGTGTSLGDPIEIQGLVKAYSQYTQDLQFCSIGSVKSNIGHAEAAAGISGLMKVILQLYYKTLVPSLHSEELNPYIDFKQSPFYVQQKTEKWKQPLIMKNGNEVTYPRRAGVSSFGATGSNAHIILEEYVPEVLQQKTPVIITKNRPAIIPLSAKNKERLHAYAKNFLEFMRGTAWEEKNYQCKDGKMNLTNLTYTLQVGREAMGERVAFLVNDIPELIVKLEAFVEGKEVIENCWQGNFKDSIDTINTNNNYLEIINKWVKKGNFGKIAELWVKGFAMEWELLYGETKPRHISLPTYPFSRERYWIPRIETKNGADKEITPSISATIHPSFQSMTAKKPILPNVSEIPNGFSLRPLTENQILSNGLVSQNKQFITLSSLSALLPQSPINDDADSMTYVQSAITAATLEAEFTTSLAEALDMNRNDVDVDTQFIDMGLDSIVAVEWIRSINNQYGISVPATKVYDYSNIRELANFIEKELAEQRNYNPSNLGISDSSNTLLNSLINSSVLQLQKQEVMYTPVAITAATLEAELKTSLAEALDMNRNDVDVDTQFIDMGLDSIVAVEWIRSINNQYGISVLATKVYDYPNIRDLAKFLEKEVGKHKKNALSDAEISDLRKPSSIEMASNLNVLSSQTIKPTERPVARPMEQDLKREATTQSVVDLYEIEPGIVQVTMQDRGHKNTFSKELMLGLIKSFELIECNSKYKVVILTGYDSYFASGGTQEGLLGIYEGKVKYSDTNLYRLAVDCKIPVIAAMQGHGVGAGWCLGMSCDFTVMSQESFYTTNFMKFGFTPGFGATLIFPEKVGVTLAKELLFTGKKYRGSELKARGVAFPILPRNEVLPYAIQLAKELSDAPRKSLIALKDHMADSIRDQLSITIEKELKMHERTFVNQSEIKKRIETLYKLENKDKTKNMWEKTSSSGNLNSYFQDQKEITDIPTDSIAIIGMSGQFPKSNTLDEFWDNLVQGRDCISEIPASRWSIDQYYNPDSESHGTTYSKWMGALENVDQFDPLFFNISPMEAELIDPQQRLFLENCWHCIEDAGLNPSLLSGSRCGVFVGCSTSDYMQSACGSELSAQVLMGEAVSFLSARISYLLNLKGPCLSIDTACSSSLVAIADACNSLLLKTSDLALAGGVCVLAGPSMHIMTSNGRMLSQDGRCFSFDARANGFVPGEGVGVILLKRLSDAIRDQDQIYGVIKGWGINQDGKTNGISAPSVNSQILLEEEVYQRFGINPETISLVEAHGTGTKLGDPIEVEALTKSFQCFTNRKNYCALGSVKSNIGHLLTAAGVTGVIKVILAMKQRMLPPTINFEKLNEHICLDNSPFYINTKLQPWESTSGNPRRACVNSFGLSGTNAHVVIEEYIPRDDIARIPSLLSANNPLLFILSAKGDKQLRIYVEYMRNWIESHENLNLMDMAYTLQVGREAMDYRLAFLSHSREDLLKVLDGIINNNLMEKVLTTHVKKSKDEVIIFESDEDAKSLLKTWVQQRNIKKIAELWVKGLAIDWNQLYDNTKPHRISLPTYPFVRERYWISDTDIQPVGNLKKVFTMKDYIHPLLQKNTSNFSEQKFSSVFTGQEFFLRDHVVNGQRVLPGVAYLEMARAAIDQATEMFKKGEKRGIRFTNVDWINPLAVGEQPTQVHIVLYPEETGDIGYEVYGESGETETESIVYSQGNAILGPIRKVIPLDLKALQAECSQSSLLSSQCYEAFRRMGIDYGTGHRGIEKIFVGFDQVLAKISLPSFVVDTASQFFLHPSTMDSALQASIGLIIGSRDTNNIALLKPSLPFCLEEMDIFEKCNLNMWALVRYSDGSKAGDKVPKLDIDLCDDQGTVCIRMKGLSSRILEGDVQASNITKAMSTETSSEVLNESIILRPVWDVVTIQDRKSFPAKNDQVLIIGGNEKDRCNIQQHYSHAWSLELKSQESIEEITRIIKIKGYINHIIWIAPHNALESMSDNALIEEQIQGVIQLFRIIKSLLRLGYGSKDLGWTVVTVQTQPIHINDEVNPTHASIHGLVGSMAKEYPNWNIRLVDLEVNSDWPLRDIFDLPTDPQGNAWVYRGEEWYRQQLIPVQQIQLDRTLYQFGGVYVVIGGAGGIGGVWSEYMIRNYQAKIIWIGRRPKDEVIEAKLNSLANLGPKPLYIRADVTSQQALQQAYKEIKEQYPQINGVVHSAIVLRDQSLGNMDEKTFQDGMSAKIDVSVRMAQVFQNEALDFVVFFSSMVAFVKSPGQSNYASGCTFKDAFAHQLGKQWSCTVKVINWGYWGSVGVVASKDYKDRMAQAGFGSIEPPEAMLALETFLAGPLNQIAFMKNANVLEGKK